MEKEKITKEVIFLEKEIFKDRAWREEEVLSELRNDFTGVILAEIEKEIVGYLIFRKILDEIEILKIGVLETFRKKGIGKALLNYLIKIANKEKAKRIFLEVRESNLIAINLYKKMGFKTIYIRKNYYKDGENALVMEKILFFLIILFLYLYML